MDPTAFRQLIDLALALATAGASGSLGDPDAGRVRSAIEAGGDPLGERFCGLLTAGERRPLGATYTPPALVAAMVRWAAQHGEPARVVDPGVGSGRFLVAAGRAFPSATLLGVDVDPLAVAVARGHLAAAGLAERSQVLQVDYRALELPPLAGPTLFLGNPPYVRHHAMDPAWKAWLTRSAAELGLRASQLAGLHVYFYLATARLARPGDRGCFVTAAEWLDVGYGAVLRQLFLGALGGDGLTVVEPAARPFPDAQATAAIATFLVGSRSPSIHVQRVARLSDLSLHGPRSLPRAAFGAASRWTPLTRVPRETPDGFIELGELCRIHRGQVTGHNRVWVAGPHSAGLPDSVLFPAITRASELFAAGATLGDARGLRRVIDLPLDLDTLEPADRDAVERFLAEARRLGADVGYVACARKAWWSVGLRKPAPILATYMARRPPAFVRNPAGVRHLNIAHGIYPRAEMAPHVLDRLAAWLAQGVALEDGRMYAGGLTKFEPREMERIRVPAWLGSPGGGHPDPLKAW